MTAAVLMLALTPRSAPTALVTDVNARSRVMIDLGPDDFASAKTASRGKSSRCELPIIRSSSFSITAQKPRRDFEALRRAAGRFISRIGQRAVAVALADPPAMVTSFDDDRKTVMERLDTLAVGPSARGQLFQGVVGGRSGNRARCFPPS